MRQQPGLGREVGHELGLQKSDSLIAGGELYARAESQAPFLFTGLGCVCVCVCGAYVDEGERRFVAARAPEAT